MPSLNPYELVAQPYTDALFELAKEEDRLATVCDEIDGLVQLLTEPLLREFFASLRIPLSAKLAMVDRHLSARLHPTTVKFLKVLISHNRSTVLPDIRLLLNDKVDEHLGRIRAVLATVFPPTPAELDAVGQTVMARFGKTAIIESVIRPELLGGFVIRVGDGAFDASLGRQLRMAERRIRERAKLEISQRAESQFPTPA